MPKSLVLGNGNIFVGLDNNAQVKDFYFPYVGLENQVGFENEHMIGVFVDGNFSWVTTNSWDIKIRDKEETMASNITAENHNLLIKIEFTDVVYNESNIFMRKLKVFNLSDRKREVKIFFYQRFILHQSFAGDTGYFDPINNTVIHYKGQRVFCVNSVSGDKGFDSYSIGNFGIEGKEGTFRDAEDGILSKNPIEHGRVDSVIGNTIEISGQGDGDIFYWLAVGKSIQEVIGLNAEILEKTPLHILKTTQDFWNAWVNNQEFNFHGLDPEVIELFKKSLLILHTHVDNDGSIIASGDSDMLQGGRDTYAYMWPRDGAYAALAMDRAGDYNIAERFFQFCDEVISPAGYFMHKYRPDKSLGSSWHPWVKNGKVELPIQEDETAIVVYALWSHYQMSRDLEFIEQIYNTLIRKTADFMVSYMDSNTGLTHPSYDLWEEKYGIHTYTSAVKYGALVAAGKFAQKLGKGDHAVKYNEAAEKIREGIVRYMYNPETKMFNKMINVDEGKNIIIDPTIDMSSIYGIFRFNVLDVNDQRVKDSIQTIEEKLRVHTKIDGIVRYDSDQFFRHPTAEYPNPWFNTTLWLAQYYIIVAKNEDDLKTVKYWLSWVAKYALESGILSEQINPYTGAQVSAAPLAWSHAEYIVTVIKYLEKLEELGIIDAALVQHT